MTRAEGGARPRFRQPRRSENFVLANSRGLEDVETYMRKVDAADAKERKVMQSLTEGFAASGLISNDGSRGDGPTTRGPASGSTAGFSNRGTQSGTTTERRNSEASLFSGQCGDVEMTDTGEVESRCRRGSTASMESVGSLPCTKQSGH
jgi:hypothetical protein